MEQVAKIPEVLVYEQVDHKPIYYKNYQDYLLGLKSIEEILGSSKLQSFIITELVYLLRSFLSRDYLIFSNELGLQFAKNAWRAADIAVIRADQVDKIDEKYLSNPPELVIEIDTKADLREIENPLSYYQEKTEDLLRFGVQKVIWIFTDTEKIMVADAGKPRWEISSWTEDVELLRGQGVNVGQLIAPLH